MTDDEHEAAKAKVYRLLHDTSEAEPVDFEEFLEGAVYDWQLRASTVADLDPPEFWEVLEALLTEAQQWMVQHHKGHIP